MSLVLRLNAETAPMLPEERAIISTGGMTLVEIEGARDDEVLAYADQVDAIMVVSAYLRSHVVDKLTRCRLISRLGTGVDKLAVDTATAKGLLVTNVPDFCTSEVADHTMALLLSVARQLPLCEEEMRKGRQPRCLEAFDRLEGRTFGILGLGRIGRAVAKRALGFGMRVLGYDPGLTPEEMRKLGVDWADFETVLAQSDYLSLFCPLTESTRGMISLRELSKMKPSAVLVNTGRGELVVESDLVTALREGIIRFAALDVFGEINVFALGGFATDHPLFGLPNVILTPHMAACSPQAILDSRVRGAQAVVDVLEGRWPRHPVNPEVVTWFDIARN